MIEKHRQLSVYMAGKRAAMILPLQCGRNRDVLDRLAQYINCLLQLKAETNEHMKEVETETDIKLNIVKTTLDSNLSWMEKLLSKEITFMLEDHKVENVHKKMESAIDSLNQMDAARQEVFKASVDMVQGMSDRVAKEHAVYQELVH